MKYQLSRISEFLKTPFPYLFLVLSIFLASTLLSNTGFKNSFRKGSDNTVAKTTENYELCLVCSGPGAHDALSDIGFTVANFVMFPVTLAAAGAAYVLGSIAQVSTPMVYGIYLVLTLVYGIALPFLIFTGYENLDRYLSRRSNHVSVYTR